MAWAINSLPVPVSPRTSTVESVGATRSTSASTDSRAGLLPMICSSLRSPISESGDLKLTEVATNTSSDFDRLRRDCMDKTLPRFPLFIYPLAYVRRTVSEFDPVHFASSKERHRLTIHEREIGEIDGDWSLSPVGSRLGANQGRLCQSGRTSAVL